VIESKVHAASFSTPAMETNTVHSDKKRDRFLHTFLRLKQQKKNSEMSLLSDFRWK